MRVPNPASFSKIDTNTKTNVLLSHDQLFEEQKRFNFRSMSSDLEEDRSEDEENEDFNDRTMEADNYKE